MYLSGPVPTTMVTPSTPRTLLKKQESVTSEQMPTLDEEKRSLSTLPESETTSAVEVWTFSFNSGFSFFQHIIIVMEVLNLKVLTQVLNL